MNVKTEKKPVAEKARNQANLMYLGPTITGVVRHSVVFKNGVLSEKVKKCMEELPAMQRLFVEVEKIPVAIKELSKKQSALRTIYTQVQNKFK